MARDANSPLTEADDEDIAVIAAMELIEQRWPMDQIARALQRSKDWLAAKIEIELAADRPEVLN